MANEQYLNKKYKTVSQTRDTIGTKLKFQVEVRKANGPKPPVVWHVIRKDSDDDLFIKDPVFNETVEELEDKHIHKVVIDIADVTGVEYEFKVQVGNKLKSLKKIKTWKRYYVDVASPSQATYNRFNSSFSMIQNSLKDSFIKIVLNKVKIDGAMTRATDLSENKGKGGLFKCALLEPKWDPFTDNYKLKIQNGALLKPPPTAKLEGSNLIIEFAADKKVKFKPGPDHIRGIVAETDKRIFNLQHHSHRPKGQQNLDSIVTRNSDKKVTINLNSAAFNQTDEDYKWNEVPVEQRVANLINTDKILELTFSVGYLQFGRIGGDSNGFNISIKVDPDETASQLAAVTTHEMGHSFGLNVPTISSSYSESQTEYRSDAPVRALDRQTIEIPYYHNADYGGSGEHCSFGCKQKDNSSTNSGKIYVPSTSGSQKTCVMHLNASHTSIQNAKFCLNCQAVLRRQ